MRRDFQKIDDDIIRTKRTISEMLYSDPDVIEILNNPKLNSDEPDTYVDVNIFDYIRLPGTITDVMNYICFDVKQERLSYTNDHMKSQLYFFYVFCHADDIKTPYGASRHDLLAYLIRDIFNYTDRFGTQLVLKSNEPGIAENYYSSRILTFKEIAPNSLNKAVKTNKYEFPK